MLQIDVLTTGKNNGDSHCVINRNNDAYYLPTDRLFLKCFASLLQFLKIPISLTRKFKTHITQTFNRFWSNKINEIPYWTVNSTALGYGSSVLHNMQTYTITESLRLLHKKKCSIAYQCFQTVYLWLGCDLNQIKCQI